MMKENTRITLSQDWHMKYTDHTDGYIYFSEDKTVAKTTFVNVDIRKETTGLVAVTEVEVTRDKQENKAKMRVTVKLGGRIEPHQIDKATENCMDALVLDLNGYKTLEGCTRSEELAYISLEFDFANVNSGTKVLAQKEKEIEQLAKTCRNMMVLWR